VIGDELHAIVRGAPGDADLVDEDWRWDADGSFARTWPSPVRVAEPVREVSRLLFDVCGLESASDVVVSLPSLD
jgi:hypothetical protein